MMPLTLQRPRAFWISLCNLVGLLFSLVGVVLLFYYALPVRPPLAPAGITNEGRPGFEAQIARYDCLAHVGLGLVIVGTLLEAVAPLCTAIGSARRSSRRP
jgi:hypothetical protein